MNIGEDLDELVDAPGAEAPDLGACCVCGRAQDGTVRNYLCLPFEAPAGTVGWGCVVCHQPMRGATAIACDACVEIDAPPLLERLRFIAGGKYPADKIRVALEGFEREAFGHNLEFHPELRTQQPEGFGTDETLQ